MRGRGKRIRSAYDSAARRARGTTIAALGIAVFFVAGCGSGAPDVPQQDASVSDALGGENAEGYSRAYRPRPFVFPDDHGPHEDYRNEWWYLTGNLTTERGRRFGYQLTLFRIALSPETPDDDSLWRTRQLYMGHFALTDVEAGKHRAFERFSRGAIGLAGARAEPFRVWLEDWSISAKHDGVFPLAVQASEEKVSVQLTIPGGPPPVLQGERGLSRKSSELGNASYYYSYTRLPTEGTVEIDGERFRVNGSSWLDREWSTSVLGAGQTGWDWFALQLDDGRDLMYYRLRGAGGGADSHSQGIIRAPDGRVTPLSSASVTLKELETWTSEATGDRYPTSWRLSVPSEEIDIEARAVLPNQEMRLTVRYWEGAVDVSGSASGQGYLEMTRYKIDP